MNENSDKPSLTRKTLAGMAWVVLGSVVGRSSGFIAQFILGWILSESDYGLYGIAISLSMVVLTLRTIGVQRIAIQRGTEYAELAAPLSRMAFVMNTAGALVLVVAAPTAARLYHAPELKLLMWVIASAMVMSAPIQMMRARLVIEGRFREMVGFDTASNISRHIATVVFALCGLGPLSFVLPLPMSAITDTCVLLWLVGIWPKGKALTWRLWKEFWAASKWLVACSVAATLVVQGNTLVLGAYLSQEKTGVFFFGFNLTMSFAALFQSGTSSVLMPMLTRLADDPARQRLAHLKVLRFLMTFACPVCVFVVIIVPSMILILWQGRWEESSFVVQMFVMVLPVYLISAVGGVALESRGEWRLNAWLHFVNGLGTIVAAWIGVQVGGLREITIAAAGFRLVYGLLHGWYVSCWMGNASREYFDNVVPPAVVCAAVGLGVWLVGGWFLPPSPWVQFAAMASLYLLGIVVVYLLLFQDRMVELRGVFGKASNN